MPNPIANHGENPMPSYEQDRINTLVCQITDGFVRGDESRNDKDVRPFEELLTHLLPQACLFTRAVVSQKLAKRRDVPRSVIDRLLSDDAAVVEPLIMHSPLLTAQDISATIERKDPVLRLALLGRADLTLAQRQSLLLNISSQETTSQLKTHPAKENIEQDESKAAITPNKPLIIDIPQHTFTIREKAENKEIRFAARPPKNPMLLAPAPIAAPRITARSAPILSAMTALTQAMVRSAVLRRTQDIAALIAKEASLSPFIALALLKDESGEALMAVSHHLGLPEDASIQIASLLYPVLTRTREKITALRHIYRSFTPEATKRIVEAWRALPHSSATQHKTVHATSAEQIAPTSPSISQAETKRASNQ
jgi:uncharacterized protein (DUF2336 family)